MLNYLEYVLLSLIDVAGHNVIPCVTIYYVKKSRGK